ncbi:MAG: hypothetical protein C4527_10920 [Candidatus Omnitrophota bacterium]|jgi:hypothetical protein|nr:MAG: hypothetical protein C4527_10920 [Candidatus Omnitrophota bacterium]
MRKQIISMGTVFTIFFTFLGIPSADETYFFWYGSVPTSVSWAPFNWEEQERASGFADSVIVGEFYNHTPDAGTDDQLNTSLTFSIEVLGNQGAHHPTDLPGGVGTVSMWVYYDLAFGLSNNDQATSIYLSRQAGPDLVKGNYIGVEMIVGQINFSIVTNNNPNGVTGPALIANDWNHLVFTDDGNSTKLAINDTSVSVSLPSGGNLWYINIVEGIIHPNGSIENGDCPETFFIDDIVCTSPIPSGIEFIDVPLTSNAVTIDGVINTSEIAGANQVSWDGSSPERPGVHAQFYGQWQLPTPEDLTATVYLQNNGAKLYISIDVVDDVISLAAKSSWWEDDSTEIYIDHDNSRSTTDAPQISVNADMTYGNQASFANWLTIMSKIKPDRSGWQVEAEVNMAARQLAQGQTYGFDISINDSDGENEPGYQGAQEWLYASYEYAYNNETYWGNIRILNTPLSPIMNWDIY